MLLSLARVAPTLPSSRPISYLIKACAQDYDYISTAVPDLVAKVGEQYISTTAGSTTSISCFAWTRCFCSDGLFAEQHYRCRSTAVRRHSSMQ
jgi:hypothetical protein